MTPPALFAHPFSSYCQKVFGAFYEKDVAFELRMLSGEEPGNIEERHRLWPLDTFPVLLAEGRVLAESSVIIEWLDMQVPGRARLIPQEDGAALEVRMMDRVFDNFVMTPMQRIVFDHLRPEEHRDAYGVDQARRGLDRAYAWLDERMAGRVWAAADGFSLADCAAAPALFYARWAHPFDAFPALTAYFERLLARPCFARCVEGGRPFWHLWPLGPVPGGEVPDRTSP